METKKCTKCGKSYTLEQLKAQTFLTDPRGNVVSQFGLILFNCSCDTTLGVEATDLYPSSINFIHQFFHETKGYELANKFLHQKKGACKGKGILENKCAQCPLRATCENQRAAA